MSYSELIKENRRLKNINDMLLKEREVLKELLYESSEENERIQRYVRELEEYLRVTGITNNYAVY